MEVETITDDLPLLANLIGSDANNLEPSEIMKQVIKNKDYLDCLTNETCLKILAILSLKKVSTSTKLRDLLGISSRDTIAYYCIRARNAGFIDIITPRDLNHQMLHKFWKGRVQNTHDNTKFFVATDELIKVRKLIDKHLDSLIDNNIHSRLMKQGKAVDKHIERNQRIERENEIKKEKIAMDMLGACVECSKALTHTHLKSMLCKFIGEDLYCQSCFTALSNSGQLGDIIKKKNEGNNGTA